MFLFADILPAFVGEETRVGLWARQCKGLWLWRGGIFSVRVNCGLF